MPVREFFSQNGGVPANSAIERVIDLVSNRGRWRARLLKGAIGPLQISKSILNGLLSPLLRPCIGCTGPDTNPY